MGKKKKQKKAVKVTPIIYPTGPCENCGKLAAELEETKANAKLAMTEIYRTIGGTKFGYGSSALKRRIEGANDGTE